MVSFRPLNRLVPLPNGLFMAYKWGVIRTTHDTWDDLSRTVVVWGRGAKGFHIRPIGSVYGIDTYMNFVDFYGKISR